VSGGWLPSIAVLALQSVPCNSGVGGTEPAKDPVHSSHHSSTHNEHDVCRHLPAHENRSVKIRYFNGLAINRDVSQPERLECSRYLIYARRRGAVDWTERVAVRTRKPRFGTRFRVTYGAKNWIRAIAESHFSERNATRPKQEFVLVAPSRRG
jgi:hypothetical protein